MDPDELAGELVGLHRWEADLCTREDRAASKGDLTADDCEALADEWDALASETAVTAARLPTGFAGQRQLAQQAADRLAKATELRQRGSLLRDSESR